MESEPLFVKTEKNEYKMDEIMLEDKVDNPLDTTPSTLLQEKTQMPLPYSAPEPSMTCIPETITVDTAETPNIPPRNKNIAPIVPTRIYLNENVTPVLLEGMKIIAKERPPNPLQVLGEYLISKSKKS